MLARKKNKRSGGGEPDLVPVHIQNCQHNGYQDRENDVAVSSGAVVRQIGGWEQQEVELEQQSSEQQETYTGSNSHSSKFLYRS